MIVTEMGVIEVDPEKGFVLKELAPGVTIEQIQAATEAPLVIEGEIVEMVMPPEWKAEFE